MTKILGIQIIGSLFGLFMLYYSFLQYKRKEFNAKEYIFWIVLWVLFISVSLFPQILDPIVSLVDTLRTLDLLTILGFLFLIGLNFYTYTIVKKDHKKIEEIVRKVAFQKK